MDSPPWRREIWYPNADSGFHTAHQPPTSLSERLRSNQITGGEKVRLAHQTGHIVAGMVLGVPIHQAMASGAPCGRPYTPYDGQTSAPVDSYLTYLAAGNVAALAFLEAGGQKSEAVGWGVEIASANDQELMQHVVRSDPTAKGAQGTWADSCAEAHEIISANTAACERVHKALVANFGALSWSEAMALVFPPKGAATSRRSVHEFGFGSSSGTSR